jgi:beta-glucosidase
MIDRRGLISGGAAAMAAAGIAGRAMAAVQTAPKGFLWGSAGAAYQIEGGNFASDLWILEHMKPSIFATPSGDADDTYNRIDEDIALAASFGFNAHRLSIEWSRIEPEQGQISYAALAYYRRVLEQLHKHGMSPVVTFIHTTVPRWFAANGGFMTADGVAPFVNYCQLVTQHMGDLITASATFNEPNINALLSWEPMMRNLGPQLEVMRKGVAAQLGNPKWASPLLADFHVQQPIMIEAHARAYDAIKAASKGSFPVGVTLALNHDAPPPNGDMTGVLLKRSQVLTPWISAPGDFVGVQNYSRSIVGPDMNIPETGVPMTQMGYPYAPEALEQVIRMVAAQAKRPIYVTENGIGTEDDTQRVAFIKVAVQGVMNCLADGLDVRGYLHWSLLDNWEWTSGYRPKFGLVAVDRQTFVRTPKPSAWYLGQIAKAGRVV